MDKLRVYIINESDNPIPKYQTSGSSGMDLSAYISNSLKPSDLIGSGFWLFDKIIEIEPYGRVCIPTGLKVEIPVGYEAQIRSRSGISLKEGIIILNSPGTIDSDYRNFIGLIVFNASNKNVLIKSGERLAQMVFTKVEYAVLDQVEKLSDTDRGIDGFGSTGK